MAPSSQKFKVKLASGRVLGPLDLDRIRRLIAKNQIIGKELAREYPSGDWKEINQFPEIAEFLVAQLVSPSRRIDSEQVDKPPPPPKYVPAPPSNEVSSTYILAKAEPAVTVPIAPLPPSPTSPPPPPAPEKKPENEDGPPLDLEERTVIEEINSVPVLPEAASRSFQLATTIQEVKSRQISQERTILFQRPQKTPSPPPNAQKITKASKKEIIKATAAAIFLGLAVNELFFSHSNSIALKDRHPIRPRIPIAAPGRPDPAKSTKLYSLAMRYYVSDTVTDYRRAVDLLQDSTAVDMSNVKALAMLASSYLNLIDSSNKDENYFQVISKLIDMTRAKAVELPETVIADVEYYIAANKAEAAQNRIVEYTKSHQKFEPEMFYYLALVLYQRGDYGTAARFLGQLPDNKIFSPKIFYLRGQVAEKLNDLDSALQQYGKALKLNRNHAKARLRIAAIQAGRGGLKRAQRDLEFLIANQELLAPKDLGQAYFLHAQLSELGQDWDAALLDLERAAKLDRDNHDYVLELYNLRAKAGEAINVVRKEAKMYFFLGEGERLFKEGKYHEALTAFLQARETNDKSVIPLVKIGDMFRYLHDLGNARINYKLAIDRASSNADIWAKYVNVLIESYDWEEAQKAIEKFQQLPVNPGVIDKALGDLYAKQGRHSEAQYNYRKAMSRDTIDSSVYLAYANSLLATGNYKEAPLFFALAMRMDPLNSEAIIGTAKILASTESIDRAITLLQDELQQATVTKADLLGAIAAFQVEKGDWDQAQQNVDQAVAINPDAAAPWKVQAEIYMSRESSERNALDKALAAYKSYSDRNPSDPTGYLERYKIFIKKTQYDKADEELTRIFGIYPKYPNLHFYKGALYAVEGNHKLAIEEFKTEVANNPNNVTGLIAMGKELIEVGDFNGALKFFNQAMLIAPKSAEAKQQSGYANFLLKNYRGAVALYNAALALDQGNPMIYKRLGLAYRALGQGSEAAQAFQKYVEMEPDAPDKAELQGFR